MHQQHIFAISGLLKNNIFTFRFIISYFCKEKYLHVFLYMQMQIFFLMNLVFIIILQNIQIKKTYIEFSFAALFWVLGIEKTLIEQRVLKKQFLLLPLARSSERGNGPVFSKPFLCKNHQNRISSSLEISIGPRPKWLNETVQPESRNYRASIAPENLRRSKAEKLNFGNSGSECLYNKIAIIKYI